MEPRLKDLSLGKRLKLNAITKIQKFLLKRDAKVANTLYYYLAKLHYSVYFDRDLEADIMADTHTAYKAAQRHSRLVAKVLFPEGSEKTINVVKAAARGSFVKNLLLDMPILSDEHPMD